MKLRKVEESYEQGDKIPSLSSETSADILELNLPEFMPTVTFHPYLGRKRQEARTRSSLIRRLAQQFITEGGTGNTI